MESQENKGKLNKAWHTAHKMPKNAILQQRIEWHLDHHKNCGCRDIPEKLKLEMEKRGKQPTPK